MGLSPVDRYSVLGATKAVRQPSPDISNSEALEAPLVENVDGPRDGGDVGGKGKVGGIRGDGGQLLRDDSDFEEDKADPYRVLLISSNDRLEFTFSPGAMETIIKFVEVCSCLINIIQL